MTQRDWLVGIVVGLIVGVPTGMAIMAGLRHASVVSNLEEWQVVRNANGLPVRIRVHRRVGHG